MTYDHQDAGGFIRLFGLPERVRALTRGDDHHRAEPSEPRMPQADEGERTQPVHEKARR